MKYKTYEAHVRYWADMHGYTVRKSRVRKIREDNRGKFMLVGTYGGSILGEKYDASIYDIADWLIENGGRL